MVSHMDLTEDPRVLAQVEQHPDRLLFASLSGAHLYGFPSQDSDVDIRGAHVLAPAVLLGLIEPSDTHEIMDVVQGLEIDVVTYDLKKFCHLLLKKNGNVLEQLVSPLIVHSTAEHHELRALAQQCICRHHVHHYRGMTKNRLRAFRDSGELKPLLYAFRAALTGIHLLRAGECEPNLAHLAPEYGVDVSSLIERKRQAEHIELPAGEADQRVAEVGALLERLELAFEESQLPEAPRVSAEVDEFLVRTRLAT